MTQTFELAVELFLAAILVGGGIFALVGSYGLLRLPEPMQRLHAPTKATTIGVGAALLVSALDMLPQGGGISWQELLITIFLLLTAPITALFLAKTLLLRHEDPATLPETGTGHPWATLGEERPDP
ncbi:monovalent cation/H(+) antiporter subunit G [Tabrizicola sp.]|uniref:monovalent cation/H(+) antiporter subunit G n=1 Tax=Tabrizicola sp. TaxID=2005166 RepID=UPI002613089E|nr:monovalent cation/H(+) antiporter subunit G [Tabrizicola sp.]MDM7932695.1 monovalent cation/H(+) antiporter subunit G [Tabrizicola sp.]